MPIFDFVKGKYNSEKKRFETTYSGVCPTLEFWKNLKIKKSRNNFECIVCNKRKPKGTHYIGSRWRSICFLCFKEWIETSNGTLLEIKERFNRVLKELENNKEKWERELIINNLED